MIFASTRRLMQRPRGVAWLLALVLWLPVAQWAAAAHGLLHLPSASLDESDRAAHPPGSCNTCVVAAAMLGAAPAPEFSPPDALRPAPSPRADPQPALAPPPQRAPYLSRAPPLPHA